MQIELAEKTANIIVNFLLEAVITRKQQKTGEVNLALNILPESNSPELSQRNRLEMQYYVQDAELQC